MISRTLRHNQPLFLVAALLTLALALFAPQSASALVYEVDSTADEADADPGTGGCETLLGACTLRAAVEESNDSPVDDEITFAAAFDGKTGDSIALILGDLQVKEPVRVLGFATEPCTTSAAGAKGPCVEVGGAGFNVEVSDVTVRGIAITGVAGSAIDVFGESTGFVAEGNWLGVKLNGTASGNTRGIFIDPGSDGATIGGDTLAERNVIANSSNEGLDVNGASGTVVRGNYFGVAPDGTTAAPNGKNIEVTDSTAGGGFAAVNTEIGENVEAAGQATAACDFGCNVISGSTSSGLDLSGNGAGENEAPATGPTIVHGNHVGLNAAGTGALANGTIGILAGGADSAQIGGPEAGDANFVAGGITGIYHENGDDFEANGNVIGSKPDGTAVTPPSTLGIFAFSLSLSSLAATAEISGNEIRMVGGIGIEQRFTGADIVGNSVEGGSTGIFTTGSTGAVGNLIAGNVITAPVATGIRVQNDNNKVVANDVFESGFAGIRVENPAALIITTGNTIGGDIPSNENTISGSGGGAIEIVEESGEPGSTNEVARNNGTFNAGLFIDLVGSANGGIKPPSFAAAKLTEASGSGALPGAHIRVFRKASTEAGELESFLAEAVADGAGNWKVSYPASIPAGTIVAATQTSIAGATSELATATSAADPNPNPPVLGCPDNPAACPPLLSPKPPVPDTRILKGPKAKSTKTTAKFSFKSTVGGSTFECKLDKKPFKKCRSPKKYKKLKPGRHVFKVRAVNSAGVKDPTPAKRKFTVLP